MSILRHRTDTARFAEGTFLFLFSVALVAVATILLFSIVSISQLDTSKATLQGSSIDNSLLADKIIGTAASYPDSNASPVSARTKSPSSSNADNTPSSTPVPPPSGMRSEEIVAEPALMLTPDRKTSGSTQGRSTVGTVPSQLSGSQGMSAQPASIADAASATAIETSLGSTQGPSIETPPPELSGSQGVSAQPASIAGAVSAAKSAAGVTLPTRVISDEQHDQWFRDFEIQRNGHTNLDQGSAAEKVFGVTPSRGSPLLRHATSHRQDAAEADHKITQKLNRLELSRLLKHSQASLR
jgi:hypothetical protein